MTLSDERRQRHVHRGAVIFWHSLTTPEQDRLVSALHFELGKVENYDVRHRMIYDILNKVDHELARRAATGIGVPPPEKGAAEAVTTRAPEVSVEHQKKRGVKTLKVAVLVADGFDHDSLEHTRKALESAGVRTTLIAKFLGVVHGAGGDVQADKSHVTTASVLFDAVFVPGGRHVGAPNAGGRGALHHRSVQARQADRRER